MEKVLRNVLILIFEEKQFPLYENIESLLSTIKDNDNIDSSISNQCYISTRIFYKKQIRAKLEEGRQS